MKTNRKYVIAGFVVVALLIGGVMAWRYYKDYDAGADLMTPGPLGEAVLGRTDAPVTVIEYASTTCPHCAHFYTTTFSELQKQFIDTGKVRYIFREYPLNNLDFFAFMLARCGGNEKFLPFVGTLFTEQEKWLVDPPMPPLLEIAKKSGFTDESIEACRANQKIFDGVAWSSDHGSKLGVNSTPTFFVNGKMYSGDMSIEELQKIIAQSSQPSKK